MTPNVSAATRFAPIPAAHGCLMGHATTNTGANQSGPKGMDMRFPYVLREYLGLPPVPVVLEKLA